MRQVFREFWQYRELFYFFVWRDLKVRYKQSILGILWAVIQPLFTMLVFTLFFGRRAKLPNDGIPYPLFYYSALLPWIYFSSSLSLAGNSLTGNVNLITKVYFPRVALPAASVFAGVVDFAIASVFVFGMVWWYPAVRFTPRLFLWPIFLVPLIVLALGVGMILSALNVRYRDIKHTIPFLVQIWLFVSPVIYPASMVTERLGKWAGLLLYLNPVSGIVEAFRTVVIPGRPFDWQAISISMVVTLVIFSVGAVYFRRAERQFADVI